MKKNTSTAQIFKLTKNILSVAQVAFFIYAFACVFYWFVELTGLEFINSIAFLFNPVFDYIGKFYHQESLVSGIVDLTGIIACVIFIVLAIICHTIYNIVDSQEELYYINLKKQHKLNDLMAQKQIEREYIAEMKKYNRFIILVDFKIQQIKSYLFDDNNVNEDELKNIKSSLLKELFDSLNPEFIQTKTKHLNDSFFVVGKIENTPQCIHDITTTIQFLSKKYSNLNISLSHDLSFDTISNESNLKEKLEFLEKAMQLNYNNCVLTTSLFKTCFELISKSKLSFTVLGSYQFLVDGKSQNYELYSVKISN